MIALHQASDDAKLRYHAAQCGEDINEMFAAEFDWASAEIQLAAAETGIALDWLLGMRLAVKRYPVETAELIDKVFAVRRLLNRKAV